MNISPDYLKLHYSDFIRDYDICLIKTINFRMIFSDEEGNNIEEIYDDKFEIEFLNRALEYVNRSNQVAQKVISHLEEREINDISRFNKWLSISAGNNNKLHFISKKLKALGQTFNFQNLLSNSQTQISRKKENSLLIGGKKPNISERFYIANKVFNIEGVINQKNILQEDKSILLAQILGCSQQTARELLNGTQQLRTPINKEIIKPYLESLN
jgi:hypothetical protein